MNSKAQLKEPLSYDFLDFVDEKKKLKDSIKRIKDELDKIICKDIQNDDKRTFLISYLITTINIADDIDFMTNVNRQTTIESLVRVFLDNYSEYFMLAANFNDESKIRMELNYLFYREIRRANLSLERIIRSSISYKNETKLYIDINYFYFLTF